MAVTPLRFDVNLSIVFTELPLLERPAAAAAAGFDAVELWWPWIESPAPERSELDSLKRALERAGTRLVGLNYYAGRLPGPDKGAASVPELSENFRANLDVAADFAAELGCPALNALYGNRVDGVSPAHQDELAQENLVSAARAAHRVDATLLIEALNAPEAPDFPLVSSASAMETIDAVNAASGLDNARFLMDLYHLGMNGEDLPTVIDEHAGQAGHIQIADIPGRGQPGTGKLDFADLFARIARTGYQGWIGLEYKPTGTSADSFGWVAEHR